MGRSTLKEVPTGKAPGAEMTPEMLNQLMQSHSDESTRILSLYGSVSEPMMQQIIMQMVHFAHISNAPISMILSTYGGSVDEMFSLYDMIKFLKPPVHTIGLGKIMSAGVLILASGEKGKRSVGRSSRIMMHPISGGAMGDIFNIENEALEMRRLQNSMVDRYVEETKLDRKQIEDIMQKGKDHYLTPDEAIEYGIADKIMLPTDGVI